MKFYTNTRKLAPRMKAYAEKFPREAQDRLVRNETLRSELWGQDSTSGSTPPTRTRKRGYNSGPELDTRDLHRIDTASQLTGVH